MLCKGSCHNRGSAHGPRGFQGPLPPPLPPGQLGSVGLSRIGLPALPMVLLKSTSSATTSSTGSTQEGRGCKPKEHFGLKTILSRSLKVIRLRQFRVVGHKSAGETKPNGPQGGRWVC